MIKPNALIAVVIVAVVMVLALLLIKDERPKHAAAEKLGESLFPDFKSEHVKAVTIKKGQAQLRLEKKGKEWLLVSHKNRAARTERVEELLSSASLARKDGTRLGKPGEFHLDEAQRTEVTFERDMGSSTLFVGNGLDGRRAFVRLEPEGTIFETNYGLDVMAGVRIEAEKRILDVAHFYDLKIVAVPADDIIEIVIKRAHELVRVQRVIPGQGPVAVNQTLPKETKLEWWMTEPEGCAVDENEVGRITSAVHGMNAESYADNVSAQQAGLDKPAFKAKIRLKDGREHSFCFGKREGNNAFLSVDGKPEIYNAYAHSFDSLNQGAQSLKKKEPTKPVEAAQPSPQATPRSVIEPAPGPKKNNDAPPPPMPPMPPENGK